LFSAGTRGREVLSSFGDESDGGATMGTISLIANNRLATAVLAALCSIGLALAAAPPTKQPRVGQIIVIGNYYTPQSVIFERLSFVVGQGLDEAALRSSEKALRKTGFWKSAVVQSRQNAFLPEAQFLDVIVVIEEQPYNWLLFGVVYDLNEFRLTLDLEHLRSAFAILVMKADECGQRLRARPATEAPRVVYPPSD
jgi:hypothetical protein